MSAAGPFRRLRARLRRPGEIAQAAAGPSSGGRSPELADAELPSGRLPEPAPEPAPEGDDFEHAPDATPDEVVSPKRVGFDGRELPESGTQSGHTPSGAGGF